MSSKVNLFVGPLKSLNRRAVQLKKIRFYSVLASLVLFALIFALYIYRAKIIGDIYIVQQEENSIEQVIITETDRQKDLSSILLRVKKMREALKNDVNFSSRSASLEDMLSSLDSKPKLEGVEIMNPKDFKLSLSFATQNDLLDFIRTTERPEFGSNLQEYSVGSFKITMASSAASMTLLDFSGTFL